MSSSRTFLAELLGSVYLGSCFEGFPYSCADKLEISRLIPQPPQRCAVSIRTGQVSMFQPWVPHSTPSTFWSFTRAQLWVCVIMAHPLSEQVGSVPLKTRVGLTHRGWNNSHKINEFLLIVRMQICKTCWKGRPFPPRKTAGSSGYAKCQMSGTNHKKLFSILEEGEVNVAEIFREWCIGEMGQSWF